MVFDMVIEKVAENNRIVVVVEVVEVVENNRIVVVEVVENNRIVVATTTTIFITNYNLGWPADR